MNKELFEENDRNIRVFGLETMKKLFETEVLLLGFTPSMTELSKNLILSGAGICLFDLNINIEQKDTLDNFVFNVNDIGKNKANVLKDKIKLFKDPCKISIINDVNEIKKRNIKYGVIDMGDKNLINDNNTIIKQIENIMIENKGILYYIKLEKDKAIFLNNILEKKFLENKSNKDGKDPLFEKDEKITEHLTLSDDEEENNNDNSNEKKEEKKEMDIVDISNEEEKKIIILKDDDYSFFDFNKKIEEVKNLIPKKLKKYEEDIINSAFNLININQKNSKNINPLNCLVNYIIGGVVCHEIINCISRKKNIRTNIYYFDGFNGYGKFLNELYDKTYD